jgi:hypothetical protein
MPDEALKAVPALAREISEKLILESCAVLDLASCTWSPPPPPPPPPPPQPHLSRAEAEPRSPRAAMNFTFPSA